MRSAAICALLAAAVLCLTGCSTEHHVTGPLPARAPMAPRADSPSNAIRLFEWGWEHRDLGAFRDVLAGDFLFVFTLGDSAGYPVRHAPFGREQMLLCLTHLFVGGGSAPPATSIALTLDPTLRALPDSRVGKNGKWHKEIVTSVDLTIKLEDLTEYRVTGYARFFVVRGDSAVIPGDLVAEPDSTRWYIDQWNDETLGGAARTLQALPVAPLPTGNATWGEILALYYQAPRVPRR